jgi:hypothetical protein
MFQGPSTEGHHHASFGDLVMAADSGCKICKYLCRFRDQIGPDDAGELNTNPFTRFCYQNDRDVPKIRFLAEVSWLEDEVPWKVIMFHTSGPKATPGWWPQFLEEINNDLLTEPWRVRGDKFPRRSIPVNTGDPEVLRLAIEWLRSCKSDHEICQKMDEACDPKYYPTRLLNIADANSQICRLCVVENGQPADGSGYVALSHCWGKDPSFLVLTSDNMDELQRGIPFSRLPKSFVDSIQTCRGLGFRYIWIDSLCIIQSGPGSEEDWQSHAATMDLIYANCELNLGVACAENAEQGAFVDRDPDFLQTAFVYMPIAMSLPDRTDTSSSYGWNSDASSTDGMNFDTSSTDETNSNNSAIVEPTTGDKESTIPDESTSQDGISRLVTIFAAHYDFQSALWELPLQQRGWVVQERFLAPRTLYFGKDRLYWECNERFQNEYLPWGLPESKNMFDGHYQRNFSIPHIVPEPTLNQLTEEDIAYLHHDWYDLVGNYSETHLTYPNKDKFVAIGAIAKKFNRLLSSQYIAGLFRSDLPLGLLWAQWKHEYLPRICEGDGWKCEDGWRELIALDSQRGSAYRAPSW